MKFKNIILTLLILPSLNLIGSDVKSKTDKNEVRYIKNTKRLPDEIYQQELRNKPSASCKYGCNYYRYRLCPHLQLQQTQEQIRFHLTPMQLFVNCQHIISIS